LEFTKRLLPDDAENPIIFKFSTNIFPIMFIGLGLGWKFEKTGGFMVTVSILIGFIFGLIAGKGFAMHMAVPFMVGALFIWSGYEIGRASCRERV